MTAHRILIVDDEPDVRSVVERSLARDPELTIRSCTCGQEALVLAIAWSPDLILLDVMMPAMDGPTTLARLRENPLNAAIPVVFMTARAQAKELEHLKSLGAAGAIAKPFDPKALLASVQDYLCEAVPAGVDLSAGQPAPATTRATGAGSLAGLMSAAELEAERHEYLGRVRANALILIRLREALRSAPMSPPVLDELRTVTHKLAGSAGLYGFMDMSLAAAKLEDSIIDRRSGGCLSERVESGVESDLDALVDIIEREQAGHVDAHDVRDAPLVPDNDNTELRHE
jgi:CheY-like chemotaxis protein/HPt (histidine-containing phosphotransfer) domain-containing protein